MGGTDIEAQAFVDYHVKLGSFPRNGKIEYYLKEIVKQPNTPEIMQQYLHAFDDVLAKTLMQCEIAPGLDVLKKHTPQARWMVLSGGDQVGLREILARRKLTPLFEADIFGGPDTKDIVLAREKLNGNIQFPALFIGDSKYDYASSSKAGLDFVFLSNWTEVQDWQVFCTENNIQNCNNIQSLV